MVEGNVDTVSEDQDPQTKNFLARRRTLGPPDQALQSMTEKLSQYDTWFHNNIIMAAYMAPHCI